jgi:hypothetical protein
MNKFLSIAAAGAVALAVSVSVSTPSMADPAADAFVGGMFGFMAGAAAASGDFNHHRAHYSKYRWERHVQACEDDWGWRYDPRTDLVTSHRHQFYCDL